MATIDCTAVLNTRQVGQMAAALEAGDRAAVVEADTKDVPITIDGTATDITKFQRAPLLTPAAYASLAWDLFIATAREGQKRGVVTL